jgi:HK97 family phage major capsid protein
MNRFTIAKLRKEKGGDGHYIWVAGNIAAGIPNTFDGVPYYEFPDLADYNTPNGIAVVYADFRRMYRIGIAKQITMLKDESSQAVAAKGKIVLTFDQFNGGAVVLPEAGALLKVST